jgi:hypothetical protein
MLALKKILIIIFGMGAFLHALFCQQPLVLTFESHALQAGANNNMTLCGYANPGDEGGNVTWDFSSLQTTQDFTGKLSGHTRSKSSETFGNANTVLDEFNNRFYLNVEQNKIELTGYSTLDDGMTVSYEKPLVKMRFPFAMRDSYSGDYYGTMRTGGLILPLSGTYEVTADGYGKLILPGMVTIENTLRVKTVKTYEMQLNGSMHYTEINTFRWYGAYNRYPLLVLTSIKTTTGTEVHIHYQAAYNNVVNSRLPETGNGIPTASIRAYPNPVTSLMNLEYALAEPGEVTIDLYAHTGKKIKTLINNYLEKGTYNLRLIPEEQELPAGLYIIKASFGETILTEEIIITE